MSAQEYPWVSGLVGAISDDIVAGLEYFDRPPLVDGGVLIGAANAWQSGAPPRVVFEPSTIDFSDADTSPIGLSQDDADRRAAWIARSLGTDSLVFRVFVWAIASPTPGSEQNTIRDMDATIELMKQVRRSCLRLVPGIAMYSGGWIANSQTPNSAVYAITGYHAQMLVSIPTPVLDYPLHYANELTPGKPPGFTLSTSNQPGNGATPETGPTVDYTPPDP